MVLLQTSPLIRNNELYLKNTFADYFFQYQGKPHETENNCRCLAKCINRLDGAVYWCYAGWTQTPNCYLLILFFTYFVLF